MNLWQAEIGNALYFLRSEGPLLAIPIFCLCATLSQIGIIRKYGLKPKKRLGQHILTDANVARRITHALDLRDDEGVIEIGPGLGALTVRLAALAKHVVAVEIDRRFVLALRSETDKLGNVHVVAGSILKVDLGELTAPYNNVVSWKVVGNLPYYISTAIIMYLVEARKHFSMAVLTLQEEFARRLVASPGSKDYSSLSIYVQYRFKLEPLFTIKPTSFSPRPDVRSAVIRLEVLERPGVDVNDEGLFFQTVRAAFGQRRKTLRRSLRQIQGLTPKIMDELSRISGVGLDNRPEDVSIQEFGHLSNCIKEIVG